MAGTSVHFCPCQTYILSDVLFPALLKQSCWSFVINLLSCRAELYTLTLLPAMDNKIYEHLAKPLFSESYSQSCLDIIVTWCFQ